MLIQQLLLRKFHYPNRSVANVSCISINRLLVAERSVADSSYISRTRTIYHQIQQEVTVTKVVWHEGWCNLDCNGSFLILLDRDIIQPCNRPQINPYKNECNGLHVQRARHSCLHQTLDCLSFIPNGSGQLSILHS